MRSAARLDTARRRSAILRSAGIKCRASALVTAAALAISGLVVAPAQAADTSTTYAASTATFANPERGLYRQPNCDSGPLDVNWMRTWRTSQNVTLALCVFYLADFKESPISAAKLAWIQGQTDRVKAAGLKLIVRFAYTASNVGDDAALDTVLEHIGQLAPYFSANADVIDVVQTGFVGAWGEGYYTQHFGDKGTVNATDWANRKAVVTKLLSVVPKKRMVQLRTPQMKRTMFGTSPVSSANAYGTTALARVGHHNDCFLADSTDQGTYVNSAVEYPYLQADTLYVPMGGETCALNRPRSDCPTAKQELAMFHYSYLNRDRDAAIMQTWRDGGCMTQIEQRLGYRFSLTSSQFPAAVARGSSYLAQIFLINSGYATPHNARSVFLVMRHQVTGAIVRVKLTTDPRRWSPGAAIALSQTVAIPSGIKTGTYDLLLSLPDAGTTLATLPEYAVRMANDNVWEPTTGLNRLFASITIS